MMQEFKPAGWKENSKPLTSQGTYEDGKKITYCWTNGITTNLLHNRKSFKGQKEVHKEEYTLQNKTNGCTEQFKPCNWHIWSIEQHNISSAV